MKRVLSIAVLLALASGCATFEAVGAAMAASERFEEATAAQFELDVVVLCTSESGAAQPCVGPIELALIDARTNQVGGLPLSESGEIHGAVPEGDYELVLGVGEMRISLESRVGLIPLREGDHALGTLFVRLVELPPGTFEEQARAAERVRSASDLPVVDFVHSPARGLMLIDARLEGPST